MLFSCRNSCISLQEYIDKRKEEKNSHFGLALATEGVLTYAALNSPSYSLAQSYLAARSTVINRVMQLRCFGL